MTPLHCSSAYALPVTCWARETSGLELIVSLLRAPISRQVGCGGEVTASTSQDSRGVGGLNAFTVTRTPAVIGPQWM